MASENPLERYLNAGIALTQLTRQRAEEIVRGLSQDREMSREQAEEWIEDILVRSRRAAEMFAGIVRDEVLRQVEALGLVRREDLTATVERLLAVARTAGGRSLRHAAGAPPEPSGERASRAARRTPTEANPSGGKKGAARKAARNSPPVPRATSKNTKPAPTAAPRGDDGPSKKSAGRTPAKKAAPRTTGAKKAASASKKKKAPAAKAAGKPAPAGKKTARA